MYFENNDRLFEVFLSNFWHELHDDTWRDIVWHHFSVAVLHIRLRVLPDGVDPIHLLLVARSLDEIVCVRLGDDLEQVALDVALDTLQGKPEDKTFGI